MNERPYKQKPLQELFDYKNQLMADLLSHESIVHLINEDVPVERAMDDEHGLWYTQVFPFEYLPEITDDAKTFVCSEVDIYSVESKTYLTSAIYIWVFTHKSLMRLPNGGGVRTDRLCSEIASVLDGSRYYGLGELALSSVKRFAPMTDFNGKLMTFNAKDFNRQFDGNRRTPGNRKRENGYS